MYAEKRIPVPRGYGVPERQAAHLVIQESCCFSCESVNNRINPRIQPNYPVFGDFSFWEDVQPHTHQTKLIPYHKVKKLAILSINSQPFMQLLIHVQLEKKDIKSCRHQQIT